MASQQQKRPPQRIAIVGGGIAGIACSWTLREQDCNVDIYEADDRLGGHANSVPFKGDGRTVNVDTGFIAMDETTYPQFTAFLRKLGVKTIPTDMSFGVSADHGAFEWGSYSIQSFCHNLVLLFSIWFWRLVFDILRFSLFAEDILDEDHSSHESYEAGTRPSEIIPTRRQLESIGTYLKRHKYSEQFMTYFLMPMVAAPWCIDPDEFACTFPAKLLIKFMLYHRLLDTVATTLRWQSFRNGSKTYVDAFQKQLPANHRLHLGTDIKSVTQLPNGASIEFTDGSHREFDHVVLAIHANQALQLLGDGATCTQRTVLNAFKTSRNVCYLHSDTSVSLFV
ncbi:amine oxidase [Lindgomyces ingoldianus]|uniref:Amine oxidase n=1 Tax=Lindgomyces ingoldianus TaxID=673940 RepID=A0ACB6QWV7_9PLEO|nr:amine oxidase [Lindgomyces ingoldianus]KAF2471479.1 amine oxidase [Lindgomyces ingoldianus]